MKAFHGDSKIKKKYLARVRAHALADEIQKGIYWENGKGCAVGCTIHGNDHDQYELELGIPEVIARLEDRIFEGLPLDLAKTWPERFLKSIKVGADLSLIWPKFASRLLTDPIGGVIQYAKTEEQIEVIQRVSDLYEAKICGLEVPIEIWRDASDSAYAYVYAAASYYAAAAASAYAYAAAASYYAASYYASAAANSGLKKAYIWQSELLLELLKESK